MGAIFWHCLSPFTTTTNPKIFVRSLVKLIPAPICAAGAYPDCSTKGRGPTYPEGGENFLVGAALPSGLHAIEYIDIYRANRLNDNNGNTIPIPRGFKLRAHVAATGVDRVSDIPVLGGQPVAQTTPAFGERQRGRGRCFSRRTGLGDVTMGVGIAWHHSPQLHSVGALDVVSHVGSHEAKRQVNRGCNCLSVQPSCLVTFIHPTGLIADPKFTLKFNRINKGTLYRSGNEFFVDSATGWGWEQRLGDWWGRLCVPAAVQRQARWRGRGRSQKQGVCHQHIDQIRDGQRLLHRRQTEKGNGGDVARARPPVLDQDLVAILIHPR